MQRSTYHRFTLERHARSVSFNDSWVSSFTQFAEKSARGSLGCALKRTAIIPYDADTFIPRSRKRKKFASLALPAYPWGSQTSEDEAAVASPITYALAYPRETPPVPPLRPAFPCSSAQPFLHFRKKFFRFHKIILTFD